MSFSDWIDRSYMWKNTHCLCELYTYGKKTTWRNKEGTHIPFREMSHGYIYRCIKYLKRRRRKADLDCCCVVYIDSRIVCLEKEFNKRMKLKGG